MTLSLKKKKKAQTKPKDANIVIRVVTAPKFLKLKLFVSMETPTVEYRLLCLPSAFKCKLDCISVKSRVLGN